MNVGGFWSKDITLTPAYNIYNLTVRQHCKNYFISILKPSIYQMVVKFLNFCM